ncbi:MAG: ASCH domain-containing protein [Treponema sp.]|jgi:uncharacterized protein YhfF|nr:ASCH domain-containing protein [Treponema sp.]
MDTDIYWQKFLESSGAEPDERYTGEFSFEASGFNGAALLALVMAEKKTAVFSAYASYRIDNEPLPMTGDLYIVKDQEEEPRCIIEMTEVSVLPYNEVTWEMARKEGEDENLDEWRKRYNEFFADDSEITGYDFSPDMNVVFEQFHVVYR